jgi:predicted nucleic acid-binding protein
MIVLDTNVLSELMRPAPADGVVRWITNRPATSLSTTTITQAELLHGVLLLPKGRRRDALEEAVQVMFEKLFAGRVMPFDSDAAHAYARIAAARRRAGRPISQPDAQIAAIARSTGCDLATRNVTDFEGCGVEILDPWRS